MTIKEQCKNRIRELVEVGSYHDNLPGTIESLGVPKIHLEHILMAIEKVKPQYKNNEFPDWITYFGYLILNLIAIYDLSQPFSNQSQEFYEFLWSIITPQ